MASSPPSIVYKSVTKYSTCPDAIWEAIVYFESGFNYGAVGDGPLQGGYSYGLFQLHVSDTGQGGQGNTALNTIQQQFGLVGQPAITYLLSHPDIQAQVGMQSINSAWDILKNSFSPSDSSWWLNFCSRSGHPGGTPSDGVTINYVQNFMARVVSPNLFGIQQVTPGSGQSQKQTIDSSWLQSLINMPPHQPCSIIWRRSCPGAKAALEGGMDLTSPNGTKVYSLGNGTVQGAGNFWHPDGTPGYGVVTVRTSMPDGSQADIYYQHISLSSSIVLCGQTGGQLYNNIVGPLTTNQIIKAGQLLGVITMGECEVGINADWGGVWGTSHPGPWLDDPENTIRSLITQGGGSSTSALSFNTGNSSFDTYLQSAFEQAQSGLVTLSNNPGLSGPIQQFDNAQQFKPFAIPADNSASSSWPVWGGIEQSVSYPSRIAIGVLNFMINNSMAYVIRGFFCLIAVVIIVALSINVTSKVVNETSKDAGNMLPLIAAVA